MKKFIIIYQAPVGAAEQMAGMSPEDAKKGMEAWMTWAKKCGDGLIDLGSPLGNGQNITKEGSAPMESWVVGYSILQAENIEEAKTMLKDHPHLWTNTCTIAVYESFPIPGM